MDMVVRSDVIMEEKNRRMDSGNFSGADKIR